MQLSKKLSAVLRHRIDENGLRPVLRPDGYVPLSGPVREVVEPGARRLAWKDSWTLFHTAPEVPPPDSDVLIFVLEPERLELVDNERWLRGDWRPVTLVRTRTGNRWEPVPAPPRRGVVN